MRGWRAWARPRGGSAARPLRRREPRMGTNICGQGAITIARMWVALNYGGDAMRHLLTVRPSAKWGIA